MSEEKKEILRNHSYMNKSEFVWKKCYIYIIKSWRAAAVSSIFLDPENNWIRNNSGRKVEKYMKLFELIFLCSKFDW